MRKYMLFIFMFFWGMMPCFGEGIDGDLTSQEKAWLVSHPVIKYAPDPAFAPYEFFEDDVFKGMAPEYLALIEAELDIKFEVVHLPSWVEVINQAKAGNIDVAFLAMTPERSEFMIFTEPVITFPNIIVSKNTILETLNEETVRDYSIGYLDDYAIEEYIKLVYSDSKLVAYNSIHEALMAVSVGDVDTYIGDTGQISYYSSKLNITNLKVHESTSFKYDLRFGVTNDNEILRGILDKTLAKIDEKQREIIKDHWIHLDEDNIFTQKQRRVIGFSFIAVLLILFFIFYWNRVLKHRVSEKTAELNALNQVLEERVKERTESLSKANDALESSMEELLTTQEKLLEAQRYSVIGELLVGIAHELNTPIGNSFISTSHLQKETNKLMENVVANKVSVQEVADYIELALQSHEAVLCNLNRVTNIINRFKDLESSKWSGKKFELELGTLISDIIEHVSNLDKQLETYDIMLVGADVKIVSYPSWYREIFGALFLNTLSHGYDGKAGGRIVIKIAEEDRRIVIVYEDYGKGIEKEVQEKVFQPFFSTGKKTKHMGLGLPIIYNLITREMGGEIRLESEAGKYTRISIVVPKY